MGVGEPIELIENKKSKDHNRCRIVQEFFSQESDNQEHLNDAMAEQKQRGEMLRAQREILC